MFTVAFFHNNIAHKSVKVANYSKNKPVLYVICKPKLADSDSEEDPLVTGEPDIWKFIPHSSKYQYAVVITLSYVAFTNGWIIMWAVFGQYTPPFRCRSVLDNTTLAETASFQTMHDLVANLSAPEYREAYGQQCLVRLDLFLINDNILTIIKNLFQNLIN